MMHEQPYETITLYKFFILFVQIICLIFLLLFALTVGSANLSLYDVFQAILARFGFVDCNEFEYAIVWHLRLPRLTMGIIAGATLAISGAVMQGITRNPLVSPFTIGVSSAAAFGASLAMVFGALPVGEGRLLVIMSAFTFALLCAFIVFSLAKLKGATPETIVLAGIAISYLFSALTALLQFFASEEELMMIVHWTFGSLVRADWSAVTISAMVLIFTIPIFLRYAWDLNALTFTDDDTAKSLGVNVARVRTILLVASSFVTATVICFTGIIGFVGLIAPHLTRFVVGGDNRFLLPTTCLTGSMLLILADIVGRTIIAPVVLPIGIIVSFVGVPMFVYLLMTKKEVYWR